MAAAHQVNIYTWACFFVGWWWKGGVFVNQVCGREGWGALVVAAMGQCLKTCLCEMFAPCFFPRACLCECLPLMFFSAAMGGGYLFTKFVLICCQVVGWISAACPHPFYILHLLGG